MKKKLNLEKYSQSEYLFMLRFAVTNAIFGIYYLLILIFRGIILIENNYVIGVVLLLVR